MKAKQLAIIFSKFKKFEKPKLELEQYTIPDELAAKILVLAALKGDVKGKKVFDLGCGTGKLGIGAAILGAKKVVCIDVDEDVIRIARENVKIAENLTGMRLSSVIEFKRMNVIDLKDYADTVIQNPPFGIQSQNLDLLFLRQAITHAKRVYSLHRGPVAREFLRKYIQSLGADIEEIHQFTFTIPYMFKFHKKPKVEVEVDLYIISSVMKEKGEE
ncbi:MAG: methyltransferase [Candidatus Aenigmarchaeota archaeon]|nr:methyltransferase [Candidatus Aenigmarchaeota archaeon]